MKLNCEIEKRFLIDKLIRIPLIEKCEHLDSDGNEFQVLIHYNSGIEQILRVMVYETISPIIVKNAASRIKDKDHSRYSMIMSPYISERTEQVCIELGIGYADLSGNTYICVGNIYISEKGNSNQFPKKRKSSNIFQASSIITQMILRKMLENPKRIWKIKNLAEEVGCSIGMVSRVKDKLCEQLWAEMTPEGLQLTDLRGLLDAWSHEYAQAEVKMIPCYTLDPLPRFEKCIKEMHEKHGIESCLTGLAGGTRYAPVVRYNRIHVLVESADLYDFIEISGCKKVESGANVILIEAQKDKMIGRKEVKGDLVASPIQIFLDCMQIKGRGEEMADAVFEKEIRK